MPKAVTESSTGRTLLIIGGVLFLLILLAIPLGFLLDNNRSVLGNVALIPIEGIIVADGTTFMTKDTISSQLIVEFIKDAEEDSSIKAIVLEINSPGGSAVASDEVAAALKKFRKSKKPVIAVIREVGASGGYWIASASDYIIANRMSITGSIGVLSSYLEFSGLMEKYGVGYEHLTAGKYKEIGSPFQKLSSEERTILQAKLNKIHTFFIEEIAQNRRLPEEEVRRLATGEFYLGVEAKELGLIDELGDLDSAKDILRTRYGIESAEFVVYERKPGLLDLFSSVLSDVSFELGQGMGSGLTRSDQSIMLR